VRRRWRAVGERSRRSSDGFQNPDGGPGEGGLIILVKRSLEVWPAIGAEVICFARFWRNPSFFMLMYKFCCYVDLFFQISIEYSNL
jgi:hypothetical protein